MEQRERIIYRRGFGQTPAPEDAMPSQEEIEVLALVEVTAEKIMLLPPDQQKSAIAEIEKDNSISAKLVLKMFYAKKYSVR